MIFSNSFSQPIEKINFGVSVTEAVNKWVVFDKRPQDSSHVFGFVYVDLEDGFMFEYSADLVISQEKFYLIPLEKEKISSVRLQPRDNVVGILSNSQVDKLGLESKPDWLIDYKASEQSLSHLVKLGKQYYKAGADQLALETLLKAYKKEPHFPGLELELSSTYISLDQFEKAIEILRKAIDNDPNNVSLYSKLGYSYLRLGHFTKGEKTYLEGIKIPGSEREKTLMSIDIVKISFHVLKNKEKFDEWAKQTRKYGNEIADRLYLEEIKFYESQWE